MKLARLVAARLRRFGGLERYAAWSLGSPSFNYNLT